MDNKNIRMKPPKTAGQKGGINIKIRVVILIKRINVISIRRRERPRKGDIMIIKKLNIGAYGKKTVYAVCSDEQGREELARLDTLEQATAVLRYIRGDNMTPEETEQAKAAIKKTDTPTDQSRRTRQAEKPAEDSPALNVYYNQAGRDFQEMNDEITDDDITGIVLQAFDHALTQIDDDTKKQAAELVRLVFGKAADIASSSPAMCLMSGFVMGISEGMRIDAAINAAAAE